MIENQLNRIEQKMDRVLELLEGKELSISIRNIQSGNQDTYKLIQSYLF